MIKSEKVDYINNKIENIVYRIGSKRKNKSGGEGNHVRLLWFDYPAKTNRIVTLVTVADDEKVYFQLVKLKDNKTYL